MTLWFRLPRWFQLSAIVAGGFLALPWVMRVYTMWWDLAYRSGSFCETWIPMVRP